MRRRFQLAFSPAVRAAVLLPAILAVAWGQSRVPPRAVVNAAGFARPGLPQGPIARGSIFSVFGENIGPASPEQAPEFPLGDALGGVSITVTQGAVPQGGATVAAIPLFVSAGQINAILPSNAPLGPASLRVRNGVRNLNPVPIEIVGSQPGVFTANGTGFGPGIVQNFESAALQPINAPSLPARRGQVVTIWATGLGPATFPDNDAPLPGNLNVNLRVWIGGVRVAAADLLYFGRSPCCAGVDQIIVRVPETAPLGCYVPVELQVGDGPPANTVTMAITGEGADCRPNSVAPQQPAPSRTGLVALLKASVMDTVDRPRPVEYSVELGASKFRASEPELFSFDRLTAIPPAGSCLSYSFAGGFDRFYGAATGEPLDAGAQIRSQGPGGTARWSRSPLAAFDNYALLGGQSPAAGFLRLLLGPYLTPGAYRIFGGGAAVPEFEMEARVPAELVWSNRAEVAVIDRAADLEIAWGPADAETSSVLIGGGAHDRAHDASYLFVCAADPAARRFAIPRRTLAGAPASRPEPGQSSGFLYVGALAGPHPQAVEGLDEAVAVGLAGQAKTVLWK